MSDISGTGLKIFIIATSSFPIGFEVSSFADDADPLGLESIQIADKAMGLNGDLISWGKASPIPMTLNVLPRSEDDTNLGILAELNRIGRGKTSSKDVITAIITYPDELPLTLTKGVITDFIPGNPVSGDGRLKTKPYIFSFENKVGV